MTALPSLSRLFRGVALCAAFLVSSTLSAVVYFDNLSQAISPNATTDPSNINSGSYYAQSFVTDSSASNFTLNTVTVSMAAADGSPSPAFFFVELWSDSSSHPGSVIQPLSGNHDPVTAGNYSNSALGVTLQPNTTYWIVGHGINSSGNYNWNYTDSSTITGGWTTIGWTFSADGSTWDPADLNAPQMLSISATPNIVPEPSTWALLAGLTSLGLIAWRKRRTV